MSTAKYKRIQSSVAEGCRVDVLQVRVERHHLPPDGVEHQLVEEGVVGPDEALDVLLGDDEVHLQSHPERMHMWRNLSSVKTLPSERQRPMLLWSISSPLPCLSILRITCAVAKDD
ncbi:hypothetical protein EYF80_063117 [Liparis tanakae]|uniref:Uncharacterized protein n=1 Tax=Liparis tanakae TaxID=230148 RepID=A0A4Z2EE22_9TELE|nr:hypothetical protein EYF80_063117 [Liparis tanakae]